MGFPSPNLSFICSMFAGSPSLPTIVVTGSPGKARMNTNVSVIVAQIANSENKKRRNRYRCIVNSFHLEKDSSRKLRVRNKVGRPKVDASWEVVSQDRPDDLPMFQLFVSKGMAKVGRTTITDLTILHLVASVHVSRHIL